MTKNSSAAKLKVLRDAIWILEQYADSLHDSCVSGSGEAFCCSDCPAGRDVCKREHAEIVQTAKGLREMRRLAPPARKRKN